MAMMECPRCKFIQPEDKFCANCGIDVESYSQPDPIQQKLLPNTTVAAVSALGIIIGVTFFFWKQPSAEKDLENRLTRDREFSAQREKEIEQREQEYEKKRKARHDAQRAAKLRAESERKKSQLAALRKAKAAVAAEERSQQAKTKSPSQLNVRFFEVSRSQLDTAYGVGQMLGESSNAGFFKISQSQLDVVTKGSKALPGAKRQDLETGTPINIITSFSPPEGAISWEFGVEILPTITESEIELSLSGGLYSNGFETLPASQDLDPETFTIKKDEALVLVGFLPHAPIEEPESAGINRTPLTILTSSDFQDFKTDFVMLIEPSP